MKQIGRLTPALILDQEVKQFDIHFALINKLFNIFQRTFKFSATLGFQYSSKQLIYFGNFSMWLILYQKYMLSVGSSLFRPGN